MQLGFPKLGSMRSGLLSGRQGNWPDRWKARCLLFRTRFPCNPRPAGACPLGGKLGEAQDQSAALAIGVFSTSGELLWSNRGMQIALHVGSGDHAPCDYFVNPTFQQLAAMQESDGVVFEGLVTLSNPYDPGVSLKGRVYRQPNELLVVCEYDVMELARLNNELAAMNREINNLQRALLHEKRRLEDTLAKLGEANDRLEVINEQKDRFLGMAAHDLRSPLGAIESAADLLYQDDGLTQPERTQFFEMILRTCRTLRNLLDSLLDVTRSSKGRSTSIPRGSTYTSSFPPLRT